MHYAGLDGQLLHISQQKITSVKKMVSVDLSFTEQSFFSLVGRKTKNKGRSVERQI